MNKHVLTESFVFSSDLPTHFHPLVFTPFHAHSTPSPGCLCPKGQVTRAQEAEENYLVKRELATVKQQSEEASAQLEQAKKTITQLQQQQQPQAVRRATESPVAQQPRLILRSCLVCDRSWDIHNGMFPHNQFVARTPQKTFFFFWSPPAVLAHITKQWLTRGSG